uniref:HTH rpiR-type domain-containing protein n=1 Tax=Bracon brevicornis TaxID=1563983 RepID=A0A6V7L299_9HYME
MQQDDAYFPNPDANVRIDLIARIEASFSQQIPSGKRIAGWLLNNLAQIPFESADSIAGYTGTTGITVGRYLRKLGYRNLEDVKASLSAGPLPPLGRYRPAGCLAAAHPLESSQPLSASGG